MSQIDNKPLYKSLTFIAILIMLLFNVIGEGRFDFINIHIDEIVNSILTVVAGYGRYRARDTIKGIV